MLIGLISDTHIPDRAKEIPEKVFEAFSEVDLIMHAGDLTSPKVIDDLEQIAPVMAIQGNMDRARGIDLPAAKVIEAEGLKIGIVYKNAILDIDMDSYDLVLDIVYSG